MRGRRLIVAILVLAAMLVVSLPVAAQGGEWVSGIQVQNQNEEEEADITIDFYWAEGTADEGDWALTFDDTIPAGGSNTYYVPDHIDGLPQNFVGAAVISSDQPIVSNVNTQLPSETGYDDNDPTRAGTSSGVALTSDTLYFTQLMKNCWDPPGWNSYVSVQNASDSEAEVTIRYYDGETGNEVAAASETVMVPAWSNHIFYQENNANLDDSGYEAWWGSAVVTGTQDLAGVAAFYCEGGEPESSQFMSYNAFTSGATKLWVPRFVRNYWGYQGGMQIQNVSDTPADVYITYTFNGSTYQESMNNLQPNSPWLRYASDVPVLSGVSGTGTAMITATQDIVITVNEDNRVSDDPEASENHAGRGITYNAVREGEQTDSIFFSQVPARYYGYSGGIQVMNTEPTTATLTVTFSDEGFTDVTLTNIKLGPYAGEDWYAPNYVAKGFNGSVTVTADKAIAGIANFSRRADSNPGDNWDKSYGDSYITYNGVMVGFSGSNLGD